MLDRTRVRPEAIWFGHDQPTSFAMLHRPDVATGAGVVICNTLGFEGLIAHRPFRHLAETLTDNGYTVLRLDYESTGDALGSASNPADSDALLDSIHDAVDLLRGDESCSTVSLVGIRIGAALACRYAIDHPVDRLVLWAPSDRGALYVRELKALNRLSVASRPAQGPADTATPTSPLLEVVGFEFAPSLLDHLAKIDLVAELDRAPARRVLVLDRDDTSPATALVGALCATGTDVDHRVVGGWHDFMVSDETQSEMPVDALDDISDWMCSEPAGGAGRTEVTDLRDRRDLVLRGAVDSTGLDAAITERPVWIDGLFALVTEPASDRRSRRALVIMANTGSVNRSGPGRLYVQLARRWANLGFTVIRVDLGGTGDSKAPSNSVENLPYSVTRTSELLSTVAWARANTDIDDVTLFGICSGAYHSFHAAVQQRNVDRLILVNPAIFYLGSDDTVGNSTGKAVIAAYNLQRPGFVRSQVSVALRNPRLLLPFVRRAVRGLVYLWGARTRHALGRIGIPLREPQDLARDLALLAGSGITTLAVFAAAEPGARYLRAFGGATLDRLIADGAVSVVDIDGGDHVFSPPAARQAMTDVVTRHLETVRPALSLVGLTPQEA
ncbi:MAG: alpha/beta fold hydrolase [Actinomycetota bacterium]|nr:alpha/beta fold hydrolase [Actinomycetota bacterium]